MLRFILIILVGLYFSIPLLFEQVFATETKIIKMNGVKWIVTFEPGKEPILKPIDKKVSPEPKPEWQRKTVKESKVVSTCDDPMGCEMTIEGDCPSCRTEVVREEVIEIVHKTDFSDFKDSLKTEQNLIAMTNNELPLYLTPYRSLRDTGHPDWICFKVMYTCTHGDPITVKDLFAGKMNASYCKSRNFWAFDFANPLKSCQHSEILNLQ